MEVSEAKSNKIDDLVQEIEALKVSLDSKEEIIQSKEE